MFFFLIKNYEKLGERMLHYTNVLSLKRVTTLLVILRQELMLTILNVDCF